MKVSKVEIRLWQESNSQTLAFASVYFDNGFMVDTFKIINGSRGIFATWPTHRRGDKYLPTVTTTNKMLYESVLNEILKAYKDASRPNKTYTSKDGNSDEPELNEAKDANDDDPF